LRYFEFLREELNEFTIRRTLDRWRRDSNPKGAIMKSGYFTTRRARHDTHGKGNAL